jgi:polyhydroxyalkanoate synthase
MEAAQRSQAILAQFMKGQAADSASKTADPANLGPAIGKLSSHLAADPGRMLEAGFNLWRGYLDLWTATARRAMGETAAPVIEPEPGDRRFRHSEWTENPAFDFIKQFYLITGRWVHDQVRSVPGLAEADRKKIDFYLGQFLDAIAPSNFVMTNPEVLHETVESNGQNLIRGLDNLAADLERGKGTLAIRMTDLDAFEIGRNLATTPGKVVVQNDIIQLIQYAPTTEKVRKRPLLIVPPWINKFYILDLKPENSFVRWVVDQGYTVFVISWVNPDARLAEKTFEDYMREGILAAVAAVEQATGVAEVNAIGYCIGGTLLGATLAYMAAKKDRRIKSATFFAAQVDFTEAGDLKVFIDDSQIANLKQMMEQSGGVLDADAMFATFNMLRANDLIWSFVINNYLMGKPPRPFDLLYWNSDQTRMPAKLHLEYLRECYQENSLARGAMVLDGTPLDLGKVKIPVFLQSSRDDHIAPARSVYKATKLFGGPITFIVAGSGHIAGVVNPPSANKYQYWTAKDLPGDLDAWWDGAAEHPGSWWPTWQKWLAAKSGPMVPARRPGDGKLKPIEDAPGSYVKVRSDRA